MRRERRLGLYSGAILLKEYRVGLGPDADDPKQRQGDRRTPVGDLYVCTRLTQSRFHRFLGLSYPTPADARRGVKERLITPAEGRSIQRAWGRRLQPPWNTALGGAVGIHGGGSSADWTLGCMALDNTGIDELFAILPLAAPVHVE